MNSKKEIMTDSEKLDTILMKLDKLENRVTNMETHYNGLVADLQTSMERLISTFNLSIKVNKNLESVQKTIENDVAGIKADGTIKEGEDNPPEPSKNKTEDFVKKNILEFFKHMWKDDESFREKFKTQKGEEKYNEELGKKANEKKSTEALLLLEARCHKSFLSPEQEAQLKKIKQEMIDKIEITKRKENPQLVKD